MIHQKIGKLAILAIAGFFYISVNAQEAPNKLKLKEELGILKIIDKHKISKGASIPQDIKSRLGATHVGGKYFLTKEPYLIEGAKQLHQLGFGVCKLWFYKNPSGYQYNSNWNLAPNISLKQLAQHPYYQQAFDVPFTTFMLSTGGSGIKSMVNVSDSGLVKEQQEYYELAKYLLQKYQDREVNFILKNWEGDWILRGGVGRDAQWGRVEPPADVTERFTSMIKAFKARQDGVNQARAEVQNTKCKVYHSIEVNKVIDAMYGVPTLTNDVLPHVEVDMVSWSAYDATDFDKRGVDLYRGIAYLRSKIKPTAYVKKPIVYIGEIGIPEMGTKNLPTEFEERWDNYLAVCLAQDIPYVVMWELYCNETAKDVKIEQPNFTTKETDLNGFWLLKPDGKPGYAMQYFDKVLKNAGKRWK